MEIGNSRIVHGRRVCMNSKNRVRLVSAMWKPFISRTKIILTSRTTASIQSRKGFRSCVRIPPSFMDILYRRNGDDGWRKHHQEKISFKFPFLFQWISYSLSVLSSRSTNTHCTKSFPYLIFRSSTKCHASIRKNLMYDFHRRTPVKCIRPTINTLFIV